MRDNIPHKQQMLQTDGTTSAGLAERAGPRRL